MMPTLREKMQDSKQTFAQCVLSCMALAVTLTVVFKHGGPLPPLVICNAAAGIIKNEPPMRIKILTKFL